MGIALASRSSDASQQALPSWMPKTVHGLTIRPADPRSFRVSRRHAIETARLKFLPEGPSADPLAHPVLVTGRVLPRDAVVTGSERLEPEEVVDAPAWLVVWRSPDAAFLRQFTSSADTDVDLFLVINAITGECCLVPPLFAYLGDTG